MAVAPAQRTLGPWVRCSTARSNRRFGDDAARPAALHRWPARRRHVGRDVPYRQSGHRQADRRRPAGLAGRRRRGGRLGPRRPTSLGAPAGQGAGARPATGGGAAVRTQRRVGAPRDARHRQADLGDVDGRHRHRRRGDRVLRRARPSDPRRLLRPPARRVRAGEARAARGVRRHRGVELPDPDRDVEVGTGARLRERDGVQAGRGHAAVGAAAGRGLHRRRPPRRRVQRRAGRRQGRSAAHPPSPHRQGLAHR